jgi:hypothetical protein
MNPFFIYYCERSGLPGLFAEPLNFVSNLAFIIAAILIWRMLARTPVLSVRMHWDIFLLTAIIFIIGMGSASWHSYPMAITHLLDVIPILVFILGYIAIFMIRVVRLSWGGALAVVILFICLSFGAPQFLSTKPLGGSGAYVPALSAMVLTSLAMFMLKNPHTWKMCLACALFSVSLSLRSVVFYLLAHILSGIC